MERTHKSVTQREIKRKRLRNLDSCHVFFHFEITFWGYEHTSEAAKSRKAEGERCGDNLIHHKGK